MTPAANEPTFEPPALADPLFWQWATRVGLRLANNRLGAPAGAIEMAIFKDGIPSPEWAQGLLFMMSLAWDTQKRQPVTA